MTRRDQTLDELFSDPLIQSVMRADRVDPARLRGDLEQTAARIARGRAPAVTALEEAATWKRLLEDCLNARPGPDGPVPATMRRRVGA